MKWSVSIAFSIMLATVSLGVRGQTQAELVEQLKAKAVEMRAICKQLTNDAPGSKCYILTEYVDKEVVVEVPAECPDPLAATRQSLQQGVTNLADTQQAILDMRSWLDNLSKTQLEQARQALDQALQDNPAP